MTRKAGVLMILSAVWNTLTVFADYPRIESTVRSRDPLFSQQQQDLAAWYSGRKGELPLMLYSYSPSPEDDLFRVASAFGLPYESLSSLNGWDRPGMFEGGNSILIPNQPGIFIPAEPADSWERHLLKVRAPDAARRVIIRFSGGEGREYLFFPGDKFSGAERILFLSPPFTSPLNQIQISSPFGPRADPFSGTPGFHPGIDFKCRMRSPVLAVRDGQISEKGLLATYGYYVIIDHEKGYQTVYAHLDEILVREGETVNEGQIIALSGNSGLSTGPHLHFEIRENGQPVNPSGLSAFID